MFSLFAVPIAFNAETLFQLWLGSVPIDAAHVLRFILLTTFFGIMTEPFAKSIHSTGKMQLISIVGGLLCATAIFSSSIGFIAPTTTISMLLW